MFSRNEYSSVLGKTKGGKASVVFFFFFLLLIAVLEIRRQGCTAGISSCVFCYRGSAVRTGREESPDRAQDAVWKEMLFFLSSSQFL